MDVNRRPNAGPRNVARWYANKCGCAKSDVRKLVGKRHPPRTPRTALTKSQQFAYFEACVRLIENSEVAYLLCLLPITGLRISEMCALEWKHVCGDRAHVFGKGQKWRWVPLTADAKRILRECKTASRWVFPAQSGPGHVAAATVRAACKKISAAIRVPLTPHVLRHTYATNAMLACVPPQEIQAALGHDKFTTTLTYLHTLVPF